MKILHSYPRQVLSENLCIIQNILSLDHLALLHHRADHIGLSAIFHLIFNKSVCPGAIALIHHTVLYGKAVRRKLINNGNIEIPIQDDRQCPWNRGSTHDQHVGHLSLISEHLPLGNTEPVLLVRDDERKVVINDLLLDQGVGAYDHVCLMGGNFPIGDAFFLCRHGSGDENHIFINTMFFKKFCHRFEMLPRKDFRRNHKGSLISILTDGQKRQYRYDRLTGANIPLDQPVHDRTASEVLQHLLQRPHLGICELIRQLIQKSSAFVLLFYREQALHILTFIL